MKNKKQIFNLIILVVLTLGLITGVILAQRVSNLKPKAAEKQIQFIGDNVFQTLSGFGFTKTGDQAQVGLRFISPYGEAAVFSGNNLNALDAQNSENISQVQVANQPSSFKIANALSTSSCQNALNSAQERPFAPNIDSDTQDIDWDLETGNAASGTRKTVCVQFKVNNIWQSPVFTQVDLTSDLSTPLPTSSSTNPPSNATSSPKAGATNPPSFSGKQTAEYRFAENPVTIANSPWKPYLVHPTEEKYTFSNPNFGNKQICVQFKASDGTISSPSCEQIELIDPPQVTGCNLNIGNNFTNFEISGKNFGSKVGIVQLGQENLRIQGWTPDKVTVQLNKANTGEQFSLTLFHADYFMEIKVQCSALSQLSISARLFCPQVKPTDTKDVKIQIKNLTNPQSQVITESVTLNKDGFITGLKAKLAEGSKYKLSLKAPKSLQRVVEFAASSGTTNVDLSGMNKNQLPLGDVYPLAGGDGVINALDKSELNREWASSVNTSNRPADLNGDSRVNSFDWSCMKQDFGSTDEQF